VDEVVRLYGLRNWVEQSYKQVKTTLGWAQYQVRSSRAIVRHWSLVFCAFTFCWWQAAQPAGTATPIGDPALQPQRDRTTLPSPGEKSSSAAKLSFGLAWPEALRQVRSWLEPAIMLKRYWCAYSPAPPPLGLQELLVWLRQGNGINIYSTA
jgi:hypothetical protein